MVNQCPVRASSRSANEGGSITNKACLLMRMTNSEGDYHDERCELLVTNLGGEDVILGMDWLHEHNPQINWVKNCPTLTLCSTTCIISRSRMSIIGEKLMRQGQKKTVNYVKIEDKPEDLIGEEDFFTEFYED